MSLLACEEYYRSTPTQQRGYDAMPNTKKTFLRSQPKGVALREMFGRPLIYGTAPSSPKWSPDGKTLAFLWNQSGEPKMDIYVLGAGDPEPLRLTDSASVGPLPVEDDERPKEDVDYAEVMERGVAEFDWLTKDERAAEKWIAYICRGNLFRIRISGGEYTRLARSSQGVSGIQVSPDGCRIGFMMNNNVWSCNLEDGSTSQLTFFGKEQVAVHGYQWSPDSRWLAVNVEDESMYERVKMPDYSREKEVKVNELRRNNVGKPLSKVRIGIVPAEGGKMARVNIPEPEGEAEKKAQEAEKKQAGDKSAIDTGNNVRFYGFTWTWDSSRLLVAYTGKSYQDWRLLSVTPGQEDSPVEIHTETIEPWFEGTPIASSPDSKYAYFASYGSGWRRIYRVPVAGGEAEQVTEGEFDVTGFQVPKKGKRLFFTANAPHPAEQHVYSAKLDGSGAAEISPDLPWSSAIASDDGASLAFISSGVMVAPEIYRRIGKAAPDKITNSPLPAFAKIHKPQVKRFSFTNESDGATVHGHLLLPRSFRPERKYPVVFSCVYAGGGKESFHRYQLLDSYMANEMGYILACVDLRASMGYGKDFFYGYHKKLGIIDAEECVSCAKYLRTLPYVDGERIGIWGGSYGGFLVLMVMCNHPGVFHTGISWKPVTDWRNYWDSYTCPRLARPEDDPEIYKATSPVFHADGLEGNLLVVHGMLDDNVLFQDAVWMIQKMIEAGKYFDLMIYPRDDHGLTLRHESLPDCMERFAVYFEEHMGLGPV